MNLITTRTKKKSRENGKINQKKAEALRRAQFIIISFNSWDPHPFLFAWSHYYVNHYIIKQISTSVNLQKITSALRVNVWRRVWMKGLLEVVALNSQTQNETCLVDVLILGQNFTSGQLFYQAIQLGTWHSFTCFELRIVSMTFKYGRIPAVSKTHLLEFYGIRHLRD